ncbi:hypothetical protein ACLQ3H_15900 [Micromonospora saelicesensis]|uniref:hypothetical protein n=1 Tax=Micromonospora saelicesensis TaxID=285676 RepID=UPI003CF6497B
MTPAQRYMRPLLERIRKGEIPELHPHRHDGATDAPYGYDIFKNKQDECVQVLLKP